VQTLFFIIRIEKYLGKCDTAEMKFFQSWRLRNSVIAFVLLAVVFYAGFSYGKSARPAVETITLENKLPPPAVTTTADFAPFWSAWVTLQEKFVPIATTTQPSDQERVWGAVAGLAASLKDPYTVFLPPEEAALFQTEINGNFSGVGMEVGIKDEVLTVIAPLKGTPAERAGVHSGDKILKINDEVSAAMKVDEAVRKIRGTKGTKVRLTLAREGKNEPFEITIVRDTIEIPTIETELKSVASKTGANAGQPSELQDGVFVIRLFNFSAQSPRLFRDALKRFADSGSDKLILDLRGNPGGFLDAAVEMASWFLPSDKVVVSEDFGSKEKAKVHRSRGYNVFTTGLKMAILVNGGSASASEILAGALQEHGIAKLVGAKTFGKGSVQELVPITPETALKVTVARWLTPKGKSISNGGLTPDIEVKMTPDDLDKKRDPQMDRAIKLLTTGK